MKLSVKFIFIAIVFISDSCDFKRNILPNENSELSFKASLINHSDTVLFTGSDIQLLNGTTGKISFINPSMVSKIKSFNRIKCYLENDSLFTASVTLPAVSTPINDLVLNFNLNDGSFYFEDGYPDWIDNPRVNGIRIQNKNKRTASWNRFIEELKKEGKLVE
jgi:hypothetical protein